MLFVYLLVMGLQSGKFRTWNFLIPEPRRPNYEVKESFYQKGQPRIGTFLKILNLEPSVWPQKLNLEPNEPQETKQNQIWSNTTAVK